MTNMTRAAGSHIRWRDTSTWIVIGEHASVRRKSRDNLQLQMLCNADDAKTISSSISTVGKP